MRRLYYLLLIILFSCTKGGIKDDLKIYYPDNKYHKSDLEISKGKNLLAKNSDLKAYERELGLFLRSVQDMTRDPTTGSLFLIEKENNHIIKLDSNGVPIWTIRPHGKGPGEFTLPNSMKVRNGKLYISDLNQNRISEYTLSGDFIQDIIPHGVWFEDFEIGPKGIIIIPNIFPKLHEGALFLIFNKKGEKIEQFGNNSIIQDVLQASEIMPSVGLKLSDQGILVLYFKISGILYVFDFDHRKLLHSISIQNSIEWDASVKAEKDLNGHPIRLRDVCITSEGQILFGWGGFFRNDTTIGMRFSSKGEFMGRIFGNKQLKYVPSQMVLENDSTLWIQNLTTYQLFKTELKSVNK